MIRAAGFCVQLASGVILVDDDADRFDLRGRRDWISAWHCSRRECHASDGEKCPCGRWRAGHDHGDEDQSPDGDA